MFRKHFLAASTLALFSLIALTGCRSNAFPVIEQGEYSEITALSPDADAVTLTLTDESGEPQSIAIIRLRGGNENFRFGVASGYDKLIQTSQMAQDNDAPIAINAGFFNWTPLSPCGLVISNGHLENPEAVDEVGVGAGLVAVDHNGTLEFLQTMPENLDNYYGMLYSFPMLIKDGQITETLLNDRWDYYTYRNPRSGLGITPDGTIYMVVIDGRHPGNAAGMTSIKQAEFMQKLGCVEALALDGGGSATLWSSTTGVLNYPCDNKTFDHEGERKVLNAIYVKER